MNDFKNTGWYKAYTAVNGVFSNVIKVIIGLAALLAAVVADVITDYVYDYNALVTMLAVVGLFSIVNSLFSHIFKIPFSYLPFMIVNTAGVLLYLFIISKYEAVGTLFVILYSVIVFIALWLFEMCIAGGAGMSRRVLGGLAVNVAVLLSVGAAVFFVTLISVVMKAG